MDPYKDNSIASDVFKKLPDDDPNHGLKYWVRFVALLVWHHFSISKDLEYVTVLFI
jgi:hypothetical protein